MRHRRYAEKVAQPPEKHNINENIKAREVRVIGATGQQLGILKLSDALRLAEEEGLDLVEVAGQVEPPVCRLLDYGKLKYKEQKKAAEARKRSATHSVKEIRVRYNTDSHDLDTKVRMAKRFIEEGDRVRFQMRFRGREVTYQQLGHDIFQKIAEMLSEIAIIDETTPLLGQRMTVTFAPRSAAPVKPADAK